MNLIEQLKANSPNKSAKRKGVVLFEETNYVVIATFNSSNVKTGKMIQVWILHRHMTPVEAVNSGADSVICGECQHRRNKGGACYVKYWQAPNAVYKAYKRGSYSKAVDYLNVYELFRGKAVRFGAYGDPALIPTEIVKGIIAVAKTWTGYTHQWQDYPETAQYFMASVDNSDEHLKAIELGFRSFKVVMEDYSPKKGEIICPSEIGVKCVDCGLCSGQNRKAKDIVIPVHGITKGRFKAT